MSAPGEKRRWGMGVDCNEAEPKASMKAPAENRPLYCSCWENGRPGRLQHVCRVHGDFQTDITTANNLIAEWGLIAQSIAQQCKWRPQGQCLATCQGRAVCNLDGLILVDEQGHSVAQASSL